MYLKLQIVIIVAGGDHRLPLTTPTSRSLKVDTVEHFIGCVVGANNPDEDHWSPGEGDQLPGLAWVPGPVTHHLPLLLVDGDLDVVAVGPVIAVPEQQPHVVQTVWLAQLDNNGTTAQLVTGVPTVPVIVLSVTIEQSVASPAHTLNDQSTLGQRGNILPGYNQTIVKTLLLLRPHCLQSDHMEHFVDRVVSPDYPDELDHSLGEVEVLP